VQSLRNHQKNEAGQRELSLQSDRAKEAASHQPEALKHIYDLIPILTSINTY
jgi:hypothetical protein